MNKKEMTFSGYGGQGVVLSSIICANALALDGYKVVQTQSFGIEARGGASKGELIYSKNEVNYLEVDKADLLIMLSEEAFNKNHKTIKDNSMVIMDSFFINSEKVKQYMADYPNISVFCNEFSQISIDKFGSDLFANVLVLGYICGIYEDITKDSMVVSIKKYIKEKFIEKNMEALNLGYELGLAQKGKMIR